MRHSTMLAGIIAVALAAPAAAQDLSRQLGGWNLTARVAASAQEGGATGGLPPRQDDADVFQGYVRLNADWTSESGWLMGANVDFSSVDRETEALNTGEVYVYAASDLGRIEVGKQDGAADQLALRAPVVALGQVRGDFARYAGTQALLSAYDTGDAAKVVYLSPPSSGFRFGVSWAPEDDRDIEGGGLPGRTRLDDAWEFGAQYQRPVGDWILGASAGYVKAEADPATLRADIDSWSVGVEARRGPMRLGAGYVDRGDSNQLVAGFDQTEISAGFAWVEDDWGWAVSAAASEASTFENRLVGVGGFYDLNDHVTVRADVVRVDQERLLVGPERGFVALAEVEIRY